MTFACGRSSRETCSGAAAEMVAVAARVAAEPDICGSAAASKQCRPASIHSGDAPRTADIPPLEAADSARLQVVSFPDSRKRCVFMRGTGGRCQAKISHLVLIVLPPFKR